mmetsp:Transcript_115926/g.322809  ORF Transcript_115926/g.322809 Transcript_115926/m.322809 type:complete len:307 (-) Transcript_115926:912-1832(-)
MPPHFVRNQQGGHAKQLQLVAWQSGLLGQKSINNLDGVVQHVIRKPKLQRHLEEPTDQYGAHLVIDLGGYGPAVDCRAARPSHKAPDELAQLLRVSAAAPEARGESSHRNKPMELLRALCGHILSNVMCRGTASQAMPRITGEGTLLSFTACWWQHLPPGEVHIRRSGIVHAGFWIQLQLLDLLGLLWLLRVPLVNPSRTEGLDNVIAKPFNDRLARRRELEIGVPERLSGCGPEGCIQVRQCVQQIHASLANEGFGIAPAAGIEAGKLVLPARPALQLRQWMWSSWSTEAVKDVEQATCQGRFVI